MPRTLLHALSIGGNRVPARKFLKLSGGLHSRRAGGRESDGDAAEQAADADALFLQSPQPCFAAFLNNAWTGGFIFAGLLLHYTFTG